MTNYRIEFIPRDESGDIRTMVDQAALNLDAAKTTQELGSSCLAEST